MAKEKHSFDALKGYIPEAAFDGVMGYIALHKIHLTVARKRESILGDYRHALPGRNHRISVNGNLNRFSFLVTLLHEIAHLVVFEKFGHRVQPHGPEWKMEFAAILKEFVGKGIFHADLEKALYRSIKSPRASTCGDPHLLRALKKYDEGKTPMVHLEQLPEGSHYMIKGGRVFRKGEKIRTRYKCLELATKKHYLFHGIAEVLPVALR